MADTYSDGPIDAVIAWVDGSDSNHAKRRALALVASSPHSVTKEANATTRFVNSGEVYYCIASILKYTPFVRHIYIVTDQHRPQYLDAFFNNGLCSPEKIIVIDHREIFRGYESVLPTFNSRSIEAMIWRIPGLSNLFLYFNDDFFINRPLDISEFIGQDAKIRVRGEQYPVWPRALKYYLRGALYSIFGRSQRPGFIAAQVRAAQVLGARRYLTIDHVPHILSVDVFKRFFSRHPDILHEQISYKFRNAKQFRPAALWHHIALCEDIARLEPILPSAYIHPGRNISAELYMIDNSTVRFGCIQSLELFSEADRLSIRRCMMMKLSDFLPQEVLLGLH